MPATIETGRHTADMNVAPLTSVSLVLGRAGAGALPEARLLRPMRPAFTAALGWVGPRWAIVMEL